MSTLIVLAIYILGVYLAYFQLQKWSNHASDSKDNEYQILFTLSLGSWFIYPIYGIIWLTNKLREE